MSVQSVPIPLARSTTLETPSISFEAPPPSVWDRLSTWASENKALAYTIAGVVVVVTGAGAVYYFTDARKSALAEEKRRATKKERRKAKKDNNSPETTVPPYQAEKLGRSSKLLCILPANTVVPRFEAKATYRRSRAIGRAPRNQRKHGRIIVGSGTVDPPC